MIGWLVKLYGDSFINTIIRLQLVPQTSFLYFCYALTFQAVRTKETIITTWFERESIPKVNEKHIIFRSLHQIKRLALSFVDITDF